jgi:hypothetical protein
MPGHARGVIPKKPVTGLDPVLEIGFRTRSCATGKSMVRSDSVAVDRGLGRELIGQRPAFIAAFRKV